MYDDIVLEILSGSIDEVVAECNIACTDTMNAITEALEIYELETISNISSCHGLVLEGDFQYPSVVKKGDNAEKDDSKSGSSSDNQKKTNKKFFTRIAELLKAAVKKIAEIGKTIWEKLKQLWETIKKKLHKLATSKILGGKPWPNGFNIDFKSGFDSIDELQDACQNVGKEMMDKFVGFGEAVKSGDREKMINFAKHNDAFVSGFYTHPRELINEQLKGTKFGKEDNAVNMWIRDAFKYEQKGSDFRMDVVFQTKMAKQVIDAQRSLPITLGLGRDITNTVMGNLRNAADEVDDLATIVETKSLYPTLAPMLRYLSSMMISTSEFGLVTVGQSSKFAIMKYNQVVDHFVSLKILKRAA